MTDAQFIAWLKTPDAIRCLLVEITVTISGVDTTLYLSSSPFMSAAGDTPATTPYQHCVTGGIAITEKLTLDGSQPQPSYGDIEIENSGGVRDIWLDPTYVWSNRQVQVYMGDVRWTRATFRKIFDGVIADIDSRDNRTLNLRLLDKTQRLNGPLTETTLGGSTANKDKLIPLCFGEVFNADPLLINPATLQYQVHQGRIKAFLEIRSNGYVPVASSNSALTGKFTLSANPASTVITASIQGDSPSGSYSNNIAPIIENIVQNYGPAQTRLSSGDLDATQLATFAAAYMQQVGFYATDRINVLDAIQQIAASVGAQVVMTTLGRLRIIPVTLTGLGAATNVTAADMEEKSLHVSFRSQVKATCKLGYCRNYRVLESPAAALPASSGDNFKQQWWTITSTDATVQAAYKLDAQPVMEETCLIVDTEAQTEADRRRDLWKVPRHIYTATYFANMMLTELGDVIQITHSRFGLAGGKTGIVVEISRDWLNGRITLGVFA